MIWSDAAGHPSSLLYPWDDLKALVGYVYSLYSPPSDHVTVDSTIVRSPLTAEETHLDAPRWDITFADQTHTRCEVIFVGQPWTRMTWVARSEHQIIIKDCYVSELRTWNEKQLLDHLHKNGYVEGWAQFSASGDVKNGENTIKTVGSNVVRTKTRSVMKTRGKAIYACPSVLHFLKVMYDVLEGTPAPSGIDFDVQTLILLPAHRFAVADRRILHRDISISNILVLPKGIPTRSKTGDRPKFIDEILDPRFVAVFFFSISIQDFAYYHMRSKPNDSKSYALIIDLDNGREMLPLPSSSPADASAGHSTVDVVSEAIEVKAKVDRALRDRSVCIFKFFLSPPVFHDF